MVIRSVRHPYDRAHPTVSFHVDRRGEIHIEPIDSTTSITSPHKRRSAANDSLQHISNDTYYDLSP